MRLYVLARSKPFGRNDFHVSVSVMPNKEAQKRKYRIPLIDRRKRMNRSPAEPIMKYYILLRFCAEYKGIVAIVIEHSRVTCTYHNNNNALEEETIE